MRIPFVLVLSLWACDKANPASTDAKVEVKAGPVAVKVEGDKVQVSNDFVDVEEKIDPEEKPEPPSTTVITPQAGNVKIDDGVVEVDGVKVPTSPGGMTVVQSCGDGGCKQACPEGATCNFACGGGECEQTCAAKGTCELSCSGGSCSQTCTAGSKCTMTCSGGKCPRKCDGAECTQSCSGNGCTGA